MVDESDESDPSPGTPGDWVTDRPVSRASFDDEVERFDSAGPGTLAEQRDLRDEEGDDIRMYTGEPVETEDGWVIPVQQNFAGRDNIAGGGEWPDPHAPPTQPPPADEGVAEGNDTHHGDRPHGEQTDSGEPDRGTTR